MYEDLQERRGLELHQKSIFPCQGGTSGGKAPLRRAIPPASYCSSQDRHRGDRTGREIGRGGIAARRRGRHGIHRGRHGTHLRAENRLDGRRADQDVGRVQRRNLGTGRIFPQGVADPLGRRAGHPHQNRRPPAQHAHAGGDADEQTDQDHGRNDLPLRTAGLPAGALFDQKRTGRPLHEVPVPAAIRRDHTETQ